MFRQTAFLSILMVLQLAVSAPAAADGRFSLIEDKDGSSTRLDRKTGTVSVCRKVGSGMVCSMAADERVALVNESEAMERRIDLLEKRIAALESQIAGVKVPKDRPVANSKPEPIEQQPAEDGQIDRALKVTENVLRRLIAKAKSLKRDF